jgi:hypothetical protein
MTVPTCSFCGRGQGEVTHLIAGPSGVFMCEACVALCVESFAKGGIRLPAIVTDDEWDVGGGWRASIGHVVAEAQTPTE